MFNFSRNTMLLLPLCAGNATKEYVVEWFKMGIVWKGQDGLPTTFTHFPL